MKNVYETPVAEELTISSAYDILKISSEDMSLGVDPEGQDKDWNLL